MCQDRYWTFLALRPLVASEGPVHSCKFYMPLNHIITADAHVGTLFNSLNEPTGALVQEDYLYTSYCLLLKDFTNEYIMF
jgi:hypothetical protein